MRTLMTMAVLVFALSSLLVGCAAQGGLSGDPPGTDNVVSAGASVNVLHSDPASADPQ